MSEDTYRPEQTSYDTILSIVAFSILPFCLYIDLPNNDDMNVINGVEGSLLDG